MRKRVEESFSPDLTPLIDVVFILLIFFLVATTFKSKEEKIVLDLPGIESGASQESSKLKVVTISIKENSYYLNGKALSLEELKKEILNRPKISLFNIRSDKFSKFSSVLSILDFLNKNGIKAVNILGKPTDS
jgi:biopolymer transport protein ExbD